MFTTFPVSSIGYVFHATIDCVFILREVKAGGEGRIEFTRWNSALTRGGGTHICYDVRGCATVIGRF